LSLTSREFRDFSRARIEPRSGRGGEWLELKPPERETVMRSCVGSLVDPGFGFFVGYRRGPSAGAVFEGEEGRGAVGATIGGKEEELWKSPLRSGATPSSS
jgi:hypothetical protein